MSQLTVVNFSHKLEPEHLEQIRQLTGDEIAEIKPVPTHFQDHESLEKESLRLLSGLDRYLDSPGLVVNLPGFAPGAAAILARIHGRRGHFPRIIHMREVPNGVPPYEVADVLDLRLLRDRRARANVAQSLPAGPLPRTHRARWALKPLLEKQWRIAPRWKKAGSIAGLAIVGTIVGENVFQIVTGDYKHWSWETWVWRLLLILASLVLTGASIDDILKLFQRRAVANVDVPPLTGLEPKTVLIVMASAPTDPNVGPHWTAVKSFAKWPNTKLRKIFVIHSGHERSVASANALVDYVREEYGSGPGSITAFMEGFETDFEDPEKITSTVNAAIALARTYVDDGGEIVLDATGGTSMASVGAAIAKLQNRDIVLSYIPNKPDGSFGEDVKEVDISLRVSIPQDTE